MVNYLPVVGCYILNEIYKMGWDNFYVILKILQDIVVDFVFAQIDNNSTRKR